MTEIKEIRPLIYNRDKIKKLKIDYKDLICPPYDVISEQQHKSLLRKKYNFVHLEEPKGKGKTKYLYAKKVLTAWKRSKIIIKEEIPSIYVYQHSFCYPENSNNKYTRTGIFCLVKSDPEYKTILPHELTKPKPVEDRSNLINTLGVQTSPPFFLVEDKNKEFCDMVLELVKPQYLVLNFTDDTGQQHKLYRVMEGTKKIQELKKFLKNRKLYIADGHHRYKVTTEYLKKVKKEFLMGYICSINDDGLLILPTHRALSGKHIIEELRKYFEITIWDGKSHVGTVLYCNGEFQVLRPKKFKRAIKSVAETNPYFVLDRVLCELEGEQVRQQIFYHQQMQEVVSFADRYNGCAFIMPAVTKQEFIAIVNAGKMFPPKSTYFYPKVPSGLLFYDVEF